MKAKNGLVQVYVNWKNFSTFYNSGFGKGKLQKTDKYSIQITISKEAIVRESISEEYVLMENQPEFIKFRTEDYSYQDDPDYNPSN